MGSSWTAPSCVKLFKTCWIDEGPTYVHPPVLMSAMAERHEFRLESSHMNRMWCMEVWERA